MDSGQSKAPQEPRKSTQKTFVQRTWNWTGIGAYTDADGKLQRGKTLWDWMELLIVPVMLAIGLAVFNQTNRANELEANRLAHQTELEIASDNAKEAVLQNYLDRMESLLLNEDLGQSPEAAVVARTLTLTALRRLDTERKVAILRFIEDANLIRAGQPVIGLVGADLSGIDLFASDLKAVNLSGAYLGHVNFSGVNLSGANLNGADLSHADLTDANLSDAQLESADLRFALLIKTNLSNADLFDADLTQAALGETNLSGATLIKADLHNVYQSGSPEPVSSDLTSADLTNANLAYALLDDADFSGAQLEGANLTGVGLSRANLSGTNVTDAQLASAGSLDGATMPNGTKHP